MGAIAFLRHGFDAHGTRYGSPISCPIPESNLMTRSAGESCTRHFCRTRAPKYAIFHDFCFTENTKLLNDAADLAPTPQGPYFRTSIPYEELYDVNARRAGRDPRGIFRAPSDAPASPAASLFEPLGPSFLLLPTVKRAYRILKDQLQPCARRRPREICHCADLVILGSAFRARC